MNKKNIIYYLLLNSFLIFIMYLLLTLIVFEKKINIYLTNHYKDLNNIKINVDTLIIYKKNNINLIYDLSFRKKPVNLHYYSFKENIEKVENLTLNKTENYNYNKSNDFIL